MTRLAVDDLAPQIATKSIQGAEVRIPDPGARVVHLQFRRFAGRPICNFHLRQLAVHTEELRLEGIREVVVFHSSPKALMQYQAYLPFDCLADPGKALYRRYRVESSLASLLHPAVAWAALRGLLASPRVPLLPENGMLGLPADFLITPDGRIRAAHYGRHAYDNWQIADILDLARHVQTGASPAG